MLKFFTASSTLDHRSISETSLSPWVWPAVVFAEMIILLAGLASLGLPLHSFLPWILVGNAAVVLLGCCFYPLCRHKAGWILAGLAAWLVVADCTGHILPTSFISSFPDTWSYDAMSGYLTDYGRHQDLGMPLVDQYASHLRNTRFVSPSLLALLKSAAGSNNILLAHTLFYWSTVFVTFCSMAALAECLGFNYLWSVLTAFFATVTGWTVNAIIIGNYDNLIFVSLLPAALSIGLRLNRPPNLYALRLTGLSVIGAAIIYTYPEGLGLVAPAAFPAVVFVVWKTSNSWRMLLRLLYVSGIAAILSFPYLPTLLGFLAGQRSISSSSGPRPGEGNFTGLLMDRFLPSLFALGTEYPGAYYAWWASILALVLVFLFVLGLSHLTKVHRWFAVSGAIMICLLCWQMVFQKYDYGAYKVVFCHSWLLFPALMCGCQIAISRLPRGIGITFLLGLVCSVMIERFRHRDQRIYSPIIDFSTITDLSELKHLTGNSPILIEVSNAADQSWALSLLRQHPLVVGQYLGYLGMTHVRPYLDRAKPVQLQGKFFILQDAQAENAIWRSGRFTLSPRVGAILERLDNPNGLESLDGMPFIWVSYSRETTLHIRAFAPGNFKLVATRWLAGPSLPTSGERSLYVSDASGSHVVVINGANQQLTLQLIEGLNEVKLRVLEAPTLKMQPNGDPRELMLGILGYYLKPDK